MGKINFSNLMAMELDQLIFLDRMIVSKKILKLEISGSCCMESLMLRGCVNRRKKSDSKMESTSCRNVLYVPITVRELLYIYKEEVLTLIDKIYYDNNNCIKNHDNISKMEDEEIKLILTNIETVKNKKKNGRRL